MDLAEALATVRRASAVDRAEWTHAQQTALWLLDRGKGGDRVKDLYSQPDEPVDDTAEDDDQAAE